MCGKIHYFLKKYIYMKYKVIQLEFSVAEIRRGDPYRFVGGSV